MFVQIPQIYICQHYLLQSKRKSDISFTLAHLFFNF